MTRKKLFGIAAVFVAATLPGLSSAQTAKAAGSPDPSQAAPVYDPTAGSIVTGLKGIVTGVNASLQTYRATARMTKLHDGLVSAIFAGQPTISISNQDILCSVRENYVQVSTDATYINTITGALDKAATPVSVTGIGDAISVFFSRYSVEVKGNVGQAKPGATTDACISDLKAWANDYYNHTFKRPPQGPGLEATTTTTPVAGGIDGFLADAGALSGLAGAIINIIQPIAVYAATQYQTEQRNASIDGFLGDPKNKETQQAMISTATHLATAAANLANKSRYQALGQFEEKLVTLREIKVDLTKLSAASGKSCADVVKSPAVESEKFGIETNAATPAASPILHFSAVPSWISAEMPIYADGVPAGATVKSVSASTNTVTMSANTGPAGVAKGSPVQFTFDTASDNFISCVAQTWKQVSAAASDVMTAATAYDTAADALDHPLTDQVKSINADMAKKLPWPPSKAPASAQAAAQLYAFGQAMMSAFSSDNLQKVQSGLDLVNKQFDVK